jgi:hypothetical protein
VGHLDGVAVDGEQAPVGERVQCGPAVVVAVVDDVDQWKAAPQVERGVLAGVAQAEEDSPGRGSGGCGNRGVAVLGEPGEGAVDAARGAVAREGEAPTLPPLPCLGQGGRQERQGAGPAGDVADDDLDEARLGLESGALRRQLDRASQLAVAHRAHQHVVARELRGQLGVRGAPSQVIGAHREHDRRRWLSAESEEPIDELDLLVGAGAERERLLELVDQQHPWRRAGWHAVQARRQFLGGVGPRAQGDRAPRLGAGEDPGRQCRQ